MTGTDDIRAMLKKHRDSESNQRNILIAKTKDSVEKMISESLKMAIEYYGVRRFFIGIQLRDGWSNEYRNTYRAESEESEILVNSINELLVEHSAKFSTVYACYEENQQRWYIQHCDSNKYGIVLQDMPDYASIPYAIYSSYPSEPKTGTFTVSEHYDENDGVYYAIDSAHSERKKLNRPPPPQKIFVAVVNFP
jgi:hypothetical protein